ncbi:MAG: histidine phosphatase family protein [Planctomycetales bacterium]|nr:histidine phosphatase family protein [Planctomycetales bacterium]
MFIYIARHAWAYEFGDPRWPDDSQRELEPDGAERYMQVVQALAKRGFAPQAVLTSPYVRCRQTAEIISLHTKHEPDIVSAAALAPGSDFDALCQWSRQSGCSQICWVGHAPDVGDLTATLVGDQRANIRFAKGAVAAVRLDAEIGHAAGELYWLATAKLLGV